MSEIRTINATLRAVIAKDEDDAKEFSLEGVAASYDNLSGDVGGFRERISPGAFSRALSEGHDVRCLFNHDANHVLGRTESGTLQLFDNPKGLGFKVKLDPQNHFHKNVHSMVKRGDVNQCSFSFTVPKGGDSWDEAKDEKGQSFIRRTLKDVNLHDVSPVTYPAYNGPNATTVAARSAEARPADIDALNRARCAAIGRDIAAEDEDSLRRRIAAVTAEVEADRRNGDI